MSTRACILYRWWDAQGNLLYIGKSMNVFGRIEQHRRNSRFFEEAATMTMERFPDALALGEAEVAAIRSEHPPYNVAHNRGVEVDYDFDYAAAEASALRTLDEMLAPAFEQIRGMAA